MSIEMIYQDDQLQLSADQDVFYACFTRPGFDMAKFNEMMPNWPQLQLTEFASLKEAMIVADGTRVRIGTRRPRIEINISKDLMKASVRLNYTDDEYQALNKEELIKQMAHTLAIANVTHGLDLEQAVGQLKLREFFDVAFGTPPSPGVDALVTYYDLGDPTPKIFDDGKVDHYDLNLIHNAKKGDWLGERLEPRAGKSGMNILSQPIPGREGLQSPLKYDKNTVEEVYNEEENKTYLYALKTGAIIMIEEGISVLNLLQINGNVSFDTGNVDFGGFVGVEDTVEDNFSVSADLDVEILGEMGIGAVNTICSREGNVYIKGGIAGKNKALIQCSGNLYTKFAADCTIECDGIVNIGFYAMNCQIKAKEVILESPKSKIIGGRIEAETKVVAAQIGNRSEAHTEIIIRGFNRDELANKFKMIQSGIDQYTDKLEEIGKKLTLYAAKLELSSEEEANRRKLLDLKDSFDKNLALLRKNQDQFETYLTTKGNGEVRATKQMYNKVKLTFADQVSYSEESNLPVTYYLTDEGIQVE